MPYEINCRDCKQLTWASNIDDLIKEHIDSNGRFLCSRCDSINTFIYRESKLQERDENGEPDIWQRWIKGIICIDSGIETFSPYIFITAESEEGEATGLHFHYYKDTRSQGGRLKHGHGPGGPPVLGINDLFFIIQHLVSIGALSKAEIEKFVNKL